MLAITATLQHLRKEIDPKEADIETIIGMIWPKLSKLYKEEK
jgi:hypothetical protein